MLQIHNNKDDVATSIATIMCKYIKNKPNCILMLATGNTMIPIYNEIVRIGFNMKIDFSKIITFNLDEYHVDNPECEEEYQHMSFRTFMNTYLFQYININTDNINFLPPNSTENDCLEYEKNILKCGGIDLCLLGIGCNNHIAFNEPYTSHDSITHIIDLTLQTKEINKLKYITKASTVGLETIMNSKEIILVACGNSKIDAIYNHFNNPTQRIEFPSTVLHSHPHVKYIIDKDAYSKVMDEKINYFNNINNSNILILSPHPDDDVIGMGGTLYKLNKNNNITVAYMTSGNSQGNKDIRKIEAINALKTLDINCIKFLDLPFYYRNERKINFDDVSIVRNLIIETNPNYIFFAGDRKDPNLTHDKCFRIIEYVYPELYINFKIKWILYYSVWECPDNLKYDYLSILDKKTINLKKKSILEHTSQLNPIHTKFDKEFWEIIINRNEECAKIYGLLPDIIGIEGFKEYQFEI